MQGYVNGLIIQSRILKTTVKISHFFARIYVARQTKTPNHISAKRKLII